MCKKKIIIKQKCLGKCENILLIFQVLKNNQVLFRAEGKHLNALRVMKKNLKIRKG